MPYKVIQTLEKGKPVLTAVPHAWERDGTLFWPKYNADKLLKIEDTYPADNWITIPCVVKRHNINNYEKAQIEISSMLYRSDIEAEEEQSSKKRQTAVLTTFKDLAKHCMISTAGDAIAATEINNESMSKDLFILSGPSYKQSPTLIPTTSDQILENQKIIIVNQQKMMLKLAELSTQLEQLIAKSTSPIHNDNVMEHNSTFSVIDSVEALDDFENNLKDADKRSIIYKKYSIVCKGKGIGLNCAYVLIDILFSRKFLTKCSWAGGSRGEESKIAFKTYKNTINLFYNLIHDCDESFSLIDCYNFLKIILKNSVKRNESKGLRASSCKHRRRRKQNTRKQNNNPINDRECGDEEDEENEDNMLKIRNTRATPSRLASKNKRNVETSESDLDTEKEGIKEEDEEEISIEKIVTPISKKIKREILQFELNIEKQGVRAPEDNGDSLGSSE